MYLEFENINQSFIGLSQILKDKSVIRNVRGTVRKEIGQPILFKISNPSDRFLNILRKGYNKNLPFAETLCLLSGVNNLDMCGSYTPNLYNYSDDGIYMRAMYSPRIRCFSGLATDYKVDIPEHRNIFSGFVKTVDQLKYIVDAFKRDQDTLQAVIEIGDQVKDAYDYEDKIKVTKDYPCTRSLMFQIRDGKLDLTVTMRSNDHIFGAHGVNITNFTLIQEWVSILIGVPMGDYYHFTNNYHFYPEHHSDFIDELSKLNKNDYKSEFGKWEYNYPEHQRLSFEEFDKNITELFHYEEDLRKGIINDPKFSNPLFADWARIFFNKWNKDGRKYTFENPYLNKLFGVGIKSVYDYSQVNKI